MLRDTARDLLNLLDQQGRETDHGAPGWMGLQVCGHVGVVFDGVEVRPGENVLPGERVAILRLMHVPQQNDREPGIA